MARLVSLSRPDGGMESEVVWINRADQERLDAVVAELMEILKSRKRDFPSKT